MHHWHWPEARTTAVCDADCNSDASIGEPENNEENTAYAVFDGFAVAAFDSYNVPNVPVCEYDESSLPFV